MTGWNMHPCSPAAAERANVLLLQFCGPVLHHRERLAAFFRVPTVDEELFAVCGHVIASCLPLDPWSLKERVQYAEADYISSRIDVNCNHVVGKVEEE